jgi:hypothetical protein
VPWDRQPAFVQIVFQAPPRHILILLRHEVKVALLQEPPEQATGVVWAVAQHMVGKTHERQSIGFRAANEPFVDGLGVEIEEAPCILQVL